MTKYMVYVDCDKNGGDDDVFTAAGTVEAETKEEALNLGEAKAVEKYGEDNVLGAYRAVEIKP
jgi:hypothetical protein